MSQHPRDKRSADIGLSPNGTRLFGDGLTRRPLEQYDLARLASELVDGRQIDICELQARVATSPEETLDFFETWATELLRAHHMPDRDGVVVVQEAGGWRWFDLEEEWEVGEVPEVSGILCSALHHTLHEEESPTWFAAAILRMIGMLREKIQQNDAWAASKIAAEIGVLRERAWWKINHENAAEDGYRMRDGRAQGAAVGAAANRLAAKERHEATIAQTQILWDDDRSLAGNYSKTARTLSDQWQHDVALHDLRPLSSETLRKIIAAAHKTGRLK